MTRDTPYRGRLAAYLVVLAYLFAWHFGDPRADTGSNSIYTFRLHPNGLKGVRVAEVSQ
jgi:hypothetical protein